LIIDINTSCTGVKWVPLNMDSPSLPFDNISSYGDCLYVKREYYQNWCILPKCHLFNRHS